MQLDVYVLVVNKKQMPRKVRPKSSEMYESFVAVAFDVFRDDITDAIVKMDKVTYGGKHVLSRIQKTVNGAAMHPVIHDMQFEASHSSYGIQVADAFCGAVHKKYEKNESEYFGTIQKLVHIVEK